MVLLVAGGTGVAAAQDGAEVEIFWDRNADGVRQNDEPPYGHAFFNSSRGPDVRMHYTDDHGVAKLEPGVWSVGYPSDSLVVTTAASAEVASGDKMTIGVHGGSICGTAWLDENADGQRQDDERLLGGHEIRARHPENVGLDLKTTTADDGTYCLRDLPVNHYRLTSNDRLGVDKTTWGVAHWRAEDADEEQLSKFDVSNGESAILKIDTPGQDISGVDTAFVHAGENVVKPLGITVVNEDGTTHPRDLRVGERIKVIGEFRATGPAHDSYRGTLGLPEGLKVLGTEGIPATVNEWNGVEVGFSERRAPGQVEEVVVFAVVEKAFEHTTVTLSANRDHVTVQIRAVADAQPAQSAQPVRRETAVRWNLVVIPVLLGAVLAVWWWRRRKTG
ncbi:hypothetical protein ACFWN2_00935 [Lentzea sp. NPDC058436]|uniref:hypothetical protein n=1 Tax=Lentzea sp. NPDC058436 TaxID=3346499 RepID=UPI00365AB731